VVDDDSPKIPPPDLYINSSEEFTTEKQCGRLSYALKTMSMLCDFPKLSTICQPIWKQALGYVAQYFHIRKETLLASGGELIYFVKNLSRYLGLSKSIQISNYILLLINCSTFSIDQTGILEKACDDEMQRDEACLANVITKLDIQPDSLNDAPSLLHFEKQRENDDIYILQNGLPGYENALERTIQKIGGHEWNISVLEVLEERASLIEKFDQVGYLVGITSNLIFEV